MRHAVTRATGAAAVVALAAGTVIAAPSQDIRVPPVAPNLAGPPVDPDAFEGQWFLRPDGFEEVRTHEFYDNQVGFGGGFASTRAIAAGFAGFDRNAANDIIGFALDVSITNDLGTEEGQWAPGTNSHNEFRDFGPNYVGTMFDTKMTIEWADDGIPGNFNPTLPGNRGPESEIFAIDYDQLGWYSFTDTGDYQVPTYDFGDITPGETVFRTLRFGFYTPIPDPNNTIVGPDPQLDLFLNRTTSLKISDYFEDPVALFPGLPGTFDPEIPYPELEGLRGSNVSVFHNIPSPGSLAIGGLALVGVLRRRR